MVLSYTEGGMCLSLDVSFQRRADPGGSRPMWFLRYSYKYTIWAIAKQDNLFDWSMNRWLLCIHTHNLTWFGISGYDNIIWFGLEVLYIFPEFCHGDSIKVKQFWSRWRGHLFLFRCKMKTFPDLILVRTDKNRNSQPLCGKKSADELSKFNFPFHFHKNSYLVMINNVSFLFVFCLLNI